MAGAKKNKLFAETLGTVSRLEYYSSLKNSLSSVSDGFKKIADSRIALLGDKEGNGGEKLLKRLDQTRKGVIVPTKALLTDRSNTVALAAKEKSNLKSLKTKATKQGEKGKKKEKKKKGDSVSEEAIKAAGLAAADKIDSPQSLLDSLDQLSNTERRVDENVAHFEEVRNCEDMNICITGSVRLTFPIFSLSLLAVFVTQHHRH